MILLKNKKFFALIFLVFCLYVKFYKFDRYFISSKNNKINITYLIDDDFVYIIPYKYWGLSNPKTNFIKFDRSNYSQEMNVLTFLSTTKYPMVISYESGDLIENKLITNYYFFRNNEIYNDPYLNEIVFGKNEREIEITSSHVRDYNPFWCFFNKFVPRI